MQMLQIPTCFRPILSLSAFQPQYQTNVFTVYWHMVTNCNLVSKARKV